MIVYERSCGDSVTPWLLDADSHDGITLHDLPTNLDVALYYATLFMSRCETTFIRMINWLISWFLFSYVFFASFLEHSCGNRL